MRKPCIFLSRSRRAMAPIPESQEKAFSAASPHQQLLAVLEREADSLLSAVALEREQKAQALESALELKAAPSAEDCRRSNREVRLPRRTVSFAMAGIALFGLAVVLVGDWLWYTAPAASGPYQDTVGVVESSGLVIRGHWAGNTALVRTARGNLVLLRIPSRVPSERGSQIHLRAYASGAYRAIASP